MDLWILLLSIIIGAVGILFYVTAISDVFRKTGIPHVERLPFLGAMGRFFGRQSTMVDIIQDIYNYNPEAKYVGFYDFATPVLMVRDPEMIKSITVKNFEHFTDHRDITPGMDEPLLSKMLFALQGEKWKDMRSLLSPAFTSSKMKMMFKLISECAEDFVNSWTKEQEGSDCTETKDAFARYTTDVIATCAFGIKVNSMRDRDNEFYTLGRNALNFDTLKMIKLFFARIFPRIGRLLGISMFDKRLSTFFMNIVESTIRTRDEQGITRPDMIQLMLETRGKRGENELTIEEMTSQAFVFFLGGFETVSTVMCFTAQELALNPDVQRRLQEEIDEVLRENNGELTYEALHKMEYLDAVINETQRLWPATVFADRMCVKDFVLEPTLPDAKPYTVKKGMTLWFPTISIQRDKKYYDEPEKFNPDRFLGDNKKDINQPTFLPFGMGPRMCIGNRFALMEIKAVLFYLLSRWSFKPSAKTVVPVVLSRKSMLAPEGGWWLKIEPRSS